MSLINTWSAGSVAWTTGQNPAAAQSPGHTNPYAGLTILVVDDDPTQRVLARDALEANLFVVEEAADGPEGLTKAYTVKPSLIILDILMPVLDGFTVCTELRRHAATKNIPILIATGVNDAASIERGFRLEANDFINKPIDWSILALRIKYILRNAGVARTQ